MVKMAMSRTKQAGSQCTLSKPLSCPNNGETLIEQFQIIFWGERVFSNILAGEGNWQ
jgi:hypothetical protein